MNFRAADNRLLEKAAIRAMPAGALAMLGMSVAYMVDSVLAGAFFTPTHIACVGIALPCFAVAFSLVNIIGNGVSLAMAKRLGRGDKEGCNRCYSMLFTVMILLGLFFIALFFLIPRQIVTLFGASGEEAVLLSVEYLLPYSPSIILTSLCMSLCGVLRVYGYNKEAAVTMVLQFVTNAGFSLLLITCTDLGFAGLGLGSTLSNLSSALFALAVITKKKLGLRVRLYRYRASEIAEAVRMGAVSTGNQLTSSISRGVVNNIVVAHTGIIGVAIFSVASNICDMARLAVNGMGTATGPLYGILFGSRDRNGFKRVFKTSMVYGFLFEAVWCGVVALATPFLMTLYGADKAAGIDPAIVGAGVYIMMAFIPCLILTNQLERVFEATGRVGRALLIAVLPDSVLFPLMLLPLLPALGYNGIWFGFGLSYVIFLLLYAVWQSVKHRRALRSVDDLLDLPKDIRENVPRFDVSIDSGGEAITGLSQKIQRFLEDEHITPRTAYMTALGLEELAVDMTLNAKKSDGILDVKMFTDDGVITVYIRNAALPYNPLDFTFDPQDFGKLGVYMAQRTAREIVYNYVYKMNVVKIVIAD